MDWTRITNKFRNKKKQKAKTVSANSCKILSEPMLKDYFTKMAADLNYRLLCEADLFLLAEQMLWVERITVTGIEYSFGDKKEIQKRKHKIFPFKKFYMPYKRRKER